MEVFSASGIGLYRGVAKTLAPVFVFVGFLTVVAAFVLLIGCADLAGLLLGRAAARRQEIAVRLALGASRGRLVRQLLTESVVLALIGGALGLALALTLTSGLSGLTTRLPVAIELNIGLDGRILAYTLGVSLICALLFGLAPARRASRPAAGRFVASRQRQRTNPAAVPSGADSRVRSSVSAALLVWSGLFAQSLLQARNVDPGFDSSGVLLAEVQLVDDRPGGMERGERAFVDLQDPRVKLPDVEQAGWSTIVPLALLGNERFRVSKAGDPQDVPGTCEILPRAA